MYAPAQTVNTAVIKNLKNLRIRWLASVNPFLPSKSSEIKIKSGNDIILKRLHKKDNPAKKPEHKDA